MFPSRKRELSERVEENVKEDKLHSWNSYYLGSGPKLRMQMFVENRKKIVKEMSEYSRLATIFLEGKTLSREEYGNRVDPFSQEEFFFWTFGVLEPNYCGAIDILNEKTYIFFPKDLFFIDSRDEESVSTERYVREKYMADFAICQEHMMSTLDSLICNDVYTLPKKGQGRSKSSKIISKLDKLGNVDSEKLLPVISSLRFIKSQNEIEVIRFASKIASDAVRFLMDSTESGMSEYKLIALFSDYVLRNGGCRIVANKTFCSSTSNLRNFVHCSHSQSWDSVVKEGELCLFDVCCTYLGYLTTVSVTFPVSGKFTTEQEKLYRVVLRMREAMLEKLDKNLTVEDLNTLAAKVLLTHLKTDFDVLNHPVEECLKAGISELFMPVKACRLVGLGEEDLAELESKQLSAGAVVVVAPGCYFVDQLLDRALTWKRGYVRDSANKLRGLGAVRLSDLVLVVDQGYQLLTDLPRSPQDLEDCLARAAKDRCHYSVVPERPSILPQYLT